MPISANIVSLNQPQKYNLNFNRSNVTSFKAENDRYTKKQIPVYNEQNSLQKMLEKQEKEQKKQKIKQNLSWTIGILASTVMLLFFGRALFGKAGAAEAKQLAHVDINWKDTLKQGKKTVPIESESTAKPLREAFETFRNTKNLSNAAKDYAGIKDGAEIVLEYGYSGTGKTYYSEQLAEAIDAIYAMIKYPDLGSPYKDAASMKVDNFFKQIPEMAGKHPNRNIVVCIDEGDALISKVIENSSSTGEARKVRAAALTGLEAISKDPRCKNVTIILTTNYHPNNGLVDSTALTRCTKKIEIPLGDDNQNLSMLKLYLKNVKAIKPEFYRKDEVKDFVRTLTTEGYSNREISKICEEAIKIFGSKLEGVADADLHKVKFDVEYLQKAKELTGQAASKTCDTMKISEGINNL